MNTVVKNSDTIYRRDMKSDKYLQEIRGKLPQKLNKLGEWFFSSESEYNLKIKHMKAVLK